MADDDLFDLEFLSLVAKISQELVNHLNLDDKILAEFLIALHDECNGSLPAYKAKLQEMEARFSDSFVENIDRLILSMHPKYKKRKKGSKSRGKAEENEVELAESERQRRMFPGLALKNQEPPEAVPDDVFLKELGDIVNGHKRPSTMEDSPPTKRRRRSASPRNRSVSPIRGRGFDDKRGRSGDRHVSRSLDERPVLYKIYSGKVVGLKDFGAFVALDGVAGRAEGESLSSLIWVSTHNQQGWCMCQTSRRARGLIPPMTCSVGDNLLRSRFSV
jgi:ATP-dependent RNA helicase DHX8/PRP22